MKCKNDAFMRMVGVEKLDKKVEVDFDVQRFLPDCNKINARKIEQTAASNVNYNGYKIPANRFECMNPNCVNSGTAYIGTSKTVYKAVNSENFSAGVLTFYVIGGVTGATVILSDTVSGTNAWRYSATIGAVDSDGFAPAVVDLAQTPEKVGDGYTPGEGNVYIAITLSGGSNQGISSIAIFDDMEDFQTSTHVKMACLTTVDGSWDLEVAENACFPNNYSYNENRSFEKTITGTKITANHWRLNPMYKRGSATEGFDVVTVERTVKNGSGYGLVAIDDMNQNECRFFSIMLADSPCVVGDAQLEKLSIPMGIALDQAHYVLVDAGEGVTNVMLNSEHIGKKVLISYPKLVDVEEFLLTDDGINEIRTSMSYVRRYTDGYKYRFVFNKVLITSYSDALSEDEGEFSVTISIQKDENGIYGHAYRIID